MHSPEMAGRWTVWAGLALMAAVPARSQPAEPPPADLMLVGARVWTGEPARPWAEAVAVSGERIVAVGAAAEVRRRVGPRTRLLELPDGLVVPGFIDNHTHFASAGRLLLGLNLLDVNEPEAFRQRVAEAAARLPAGAWLLGGDWGAYAQWRKGSTGGASPASAAPFEPTRALIDGATGGRPALVTRFNRQAAVANSLALQAAGITAATPDPEGGRIARDGAGQPTGLLLGSAAGLVERVVPPPSYGQRRAEARRALQEARSWGVTTIHDNVADAGQLGMFRDLRRDGELTVRVWARRWLSDWETVRDEIAREGLPAVAGGWGDDWIRLGGLKAWVDGIMGNSTALFFEPYRHQPDSVGRLRDVMFPEGNLYRLIKGADRAGFTVTVHAIGDKANRILLDTYARVFGENPARDRRFRVVHAQVVHPDDFARFDALGLVAEVQPYHCIDDMRWMEERIGERARHAYAFRALRRGGARLTFGSDWPGTNASYDPVSPLLGLYAAVTRQTLEGQPAGGWFPDQALTLEEAMHAFTVENAWSTFEEDAKGVIREGLLADLAVLDRDIFARPARELRDTRVLYTVVGGRIVHEPSPSAAGKERHHADVHP